MFRARRHRRITHWLALVAMVLASLAPTVSHALAAASGSSSWVEVCSAEGSRWVTLDDVDDSRPAAPSDTAAGHLDPCPLCLLGSQPLAPPPAVGSLALSSQARLGPPERFFTAPHTAHAWRAAQPRAPPFVS